MRARRQSIADLRVAKFAVINVSVLCPQGTGTKQFAHEQHTKAPEDAAAGGGGGLVLSAALGWLVGIGIVAILVLSLASAGPNHCRARKRWRGSSDRGTSGNSHRLGNPGI
jgi:hypothetical protein